MQSLRVNTLDLESYSRVLVSRDIHKWPMDAIKHKLSPCALMRCIRKKWWKIKLWRGCRYFVQVWRLLRRDQQDQQGSQFYFCEILLYRNKLFPAFFHATCGGWRECLRVMETRYWALSGVEFRFCSESPHYSGRHRWILKLLRKNLKTAIV